MVRKDKNIIVVVGKEIKTRIEEVDIFKLRYWRDNPRVNSIVKQKYGSEISDKDIEEELWHLDSVKELFQDIRQNKGLIDEIFVRKDLVLEGNSRLCAYRHLYKKAKDEDEKSQWLRIRARIIPDDTSDEIIYALLSTWHIKGKAEWKTFEKAAYIYRLENEYGRTLDEISAMTRIKSIVDIKNMIESYQIMINKKMDSAKDQNKFSAVYEIVKNRKMKDIKAREPELFEKSIESVKNGRFARAEEVRDLPKIIKDKKARKAFFDDEEDFKYSLDIAKSRHPEHSDIFFRQLKKTIKILQDITVEKIEEIKQNSKKKYIVDKLQRTVNNLVKKIQ